MSSPTICPACVGLPDAPLKQAALGAQRIVLSVPAVHCVACIVAIERSLKNVEGVVAARVNLSMKQVTIRVDAPITPEALIDVIEHAGFEARALDASLLDAGTDTHGRALLTRVAIAGFAMMNVMLLSVAVWSGAVGATQHLFHIVSAAIAFPAVAYAGQPFFQSACRALSARRLNMDVPISLAILLASGMSLFETFVGGAQVYFDAAISLTFFLLVGRYLDHRSRKAAASAAAQLAALEVPRVMRLSDDRREMVDFADLAVGDLIKILPGGRIPVDGMVTEGHSQIDRALLTGESKTHAVGPDVGVTAGEVNMIGPLLIRATTVGEDTTLRKMVTMVDQAEAVRNRYTAIADRAAAIYAPAVHLLALAAFVVWVMISGDARLSLNIAVATLIITCPCALGLAVPAVSTAAAGRLFRTGLLVKDGTALERLAEIDTVVFDKTGTLTMPAVTNNTLSGQAQSIALGLTQNATHPVSQAIAASLLNVVPAQLQDQQEHPGRGLSARYSGQLVRLGSGDWLGMPPGTYLQIGDASPQRINLQSWLRPGAQDLVHEWKKMGLALHLVSGDDADETARVANELDLDHWRAGVQPAQKVSYVNRLQAAGAKVLMVGDGLNDTAALAAAHASVSPATAADAARAASDVVLLSDTLSSLIVLPLMARKARRLILQNFVISAGYNAVAVPIALLGFATPLLAAIAMSMSSITVLLNALRVKGRT